MLEMGTSGLMSGEGKRAGCSCTRNRALPRLYAEVFDYRESPSGEGGDEPGALCGSGQRDQGAVDAQQRQPETHAGHRGAGQEGGRGACRLSF